MNRLALLPWRLSARALGSSSIGQAVGAGATSWHTETQVGIVLEAHMWQNKRAWVLDAHMQALSEAPVSRAHLLPRYNHRKPVYATIYI